ALVGAPVAVAEHVHAGRGDSVPGNFDLADDGTLVYLEQTPFPTWATPHLVDGNGSRQPVGLEPGRYRAPRVSPDGAELAIEVIGDDGRSTIWIHDLTGRRPFRLLPGTGNSTRPLWTPDGEWITFASDRDGTWGIYRQP